MGQSCRILVRQGDTTAPILFREDGHDWTLMSERCYAGTYVAGHSVGQSPAGVACVLGYNVRPSHSSVTLMVNSFLLFNGVPPAVSSGTGAFWQDLGPFSEGAFAWEIVGAA